MPIRVGYLRVHLARATPTTVTPAANERRRPGADLKGGLRGSGPLQLVHQWKYGEGEGEEEVEERRKIERDEE